MLSLANNKCPPFGLNSLYVAMSSPGTTAGLVSFLVCAAPGCVLSGAVLLH